MSFRVSVFTRTAPGGRLRKARGEGVSPRKTTMTAAWRVIRLALAHPSMIAAPSDPRSSPVEAANVNKVMTSCIRSLGLRKIMHDL